MHGGHYFVKLDLYCTAEGAAVQKMTAQLGMLQPLLAGVTGAFHHLSLQWVTLHKGVAKLGYIVTSLLSGVVQEGYCTATEQQETEGGQSTLAATLFAACRWRIIGIRFMLARNIAYQMHIAAEGGCILTVSSSQPHPELIPGIIDKCLLS